MTKTTSQTPRPPRDQAAHLHPAQMTPKLRLGAITYDTRSGSIAPNPSGSIRVAETAKERQP